MCKKILTCKYFTLKSFKLANLSQEKSASAKLELFYCVYFNETALKAFSVQAYRPPPSLPPPPAAHLQLENPLVESSPTPAALDSFDRQTEIGAGENVVDITEEEVRSEL